MNRNTSRYAVLLAVFSSFFPSVLAFASLPSAHSFTVRSRRSEWTTLHASSMESIAVRLKQLVVDFMAGSDYDAKKVNAEIDKFVKEHPVAVISYTTCPYCSKAKAALDERGITYTSWEIDREEDRGLPLRAELGRRFQRTSVPAIFVGGRFIGGCDDGPGLLPLLANGEFDKLLTNEQSS